MNPTDLLLRLRELDVKLWVEGEQIRVSPPDALSTELRAELAAREADVVRFLRSVAPAAATPTRAPGVQRVPRDQDLPLSFAQQRFWFLAQIGEENAAYHMTLALRLRGPANVAALAWSLGEIVRRHEILRTTFRAAGDEPVQVIGAPDDFALTQLDVSGENDTEAAARAAAQEEFERPFDLATGPLLRALLVRLSANEHWLLVTTHHIVADRWSYGVLCDELAPLYAARLRNEPTRLAELDVQYADFASWQLSWYEQHRDELIGYWRRQLEGAPTLELPTDRARPPQQTFRGQNHAFSLPTTMVERLKALGRKEHCTFFMTALAAFNVLLARYSGQDDIVVGTPAANRNRLETEHMIGPFLNSLVLRVDLSGHPSFRELLARVREVSLGANQHQEMPFEQLVVELAPERDQSRNPLFQVVFNLLTEAPELALEGVEVEQIVPDTVAANSDVSLTLDEHEGGVAAAFQYNTDLFDAATIQRMAAHYTRLLEGAVERPDDSVWSLPILTDAERKTLLVVPNRTELEYPAERRVHEMFAEQARATPDGVAAVCGTEQMTYAELDAAANRLAHYLRSRGAGPEQLVGISVERSLAMLVGLLGIWKSGAGYVPLDPEFPNDRLSFIIEDAGIQLLVAQDSVLGKLPAELPELVCTDREADTIAAQSSAAPSAPGDAGSLAYAIFTSGSTGRPKGVQIEHRALLNFLTSMAERPGLSAEDVLVAVTTISFDIAGLELYLPLLVGGRVVIAEDGVEADGRALSALLEDSGATAMQATPATWQMLLESGWSGDDSLQALCGGEALPRDLAEQLLPRCRELWNMYGPTETTIWSLVERVSSGTGPVPIGQPIGNTQIYITDRYGNPVPIGVPGALCLSGDGLARGYLGRASLTAEKFVPDNVSGIPGRRLYDTGDVARWLEDGTIEFRGRADHQLKIRGFRIEPGEIEHVLTTHPAVRQCIAVAQTTPSGDQQLSAHVVLEPDASTTVAELRATARTSLPAYMVPAIITLLDELPLTPNGKVDRRALAIASTQRQAEEAFLAPRSGLEEKITAVWAEILELDQVGVHDNFFDLGGHSLRLLRVRRKLGEFDYDVSIPELFEFPTVATLAEHLAGDAEPKSSLRSSAADRAKQQRAADRGAVAVIGMAGRFPDAPDLRAFWHNLRDGVESVRFFTTEELRAAGVDEERLRHPGLVRARAVVDDADLFDAWFFDYNPREAELIDPQQRIFLECAWEALERAGYDPERYGGMIGVYAGASLNAYLRNIDSRPDVVAAAGEYQVMVSSLPDFLPLRVSYKLNLRGPSVNVQTACSTSLVAVHEACASLLEHRCDIALAGGVSIATPSNWGYIHEPGGILSPDGHCRPFDADSKGTIPGDGVGIVVLKRLDEALRDGDHIHAVVRGTATNNDGAQKVGFTAPSVDGQAQVVAMAQAFGGIDADSIGYVEAHGTGTTLGDPIEVAALTKVFREQTQETGFCALGSLKSNLGHLDVAAGVAGFIKTVLALEHKEVPPSLHYESGNPEIDFANSPFFVNAECREWRTDSGTPRRAGVSSLGIGGTNAHVVLEEAPRHEPSSAGKPWQLLVLSAKTSEALDLAAAKLSAHLRAHEPDLADAAYTLQVGRRNFEHRRAIVCRNIEEATLALEGGAPQAVSAGHAPGSKRSVVFMFPGQGAQYVNMGLGLYREESVFRDTVDRCLNWLDAEMSLDVRSTLYPSNGTGKQASERLTRTSFAQPALFVVEYALAQLWRSWGIEPTACIGHSVGEFVAACLAGVLELEDALRLIAIRGSLMEQMPTGAMLAVPLPEEQVRELIAPETELWLAAINGPSLCSVAGTHEAVAGLESRLATEELDHRRLHTSHAFHSGLMENAVAPFAEAAGGVASGAPTIPYVSNVTGDWISAAQVSDPSYWGRHIREPVRFADGLEKLLDDGSRILLEVGPGGVLGALARQHPSCGRERAIVSSLRHPKDQTADGQHLTTALGRLWVGGAAADWSRYHAGERRHRTILPTYPFARERYWIEPRRDSAGTHGVLAKRRDIDTWFYVPTWKPAFLAGTVRESAPDRRWLIFEGTNEIARAVTSRLSETATVVRVVAGDEYSELSPSCYAIDPRDPQDYRRLASALVASGLTPTDLVHGFALASDDEADPLRDRPLDGSLYSLLFLAQAFASVAGDAELRLTLLTDRTFGVIPGEPICPSRASIQGLARVIPQEQARMTCRTIDTGRPGDVAEVGRTAALLVDELSSASTDIAVAFRAGCRWVQTYDGVETTDAPTPVRDGGVYLITGGTGRVGLAMAEALARSAPVRLVLTGRSAFPGPTEWDRWVEEHGEDDRISNTIGRLRAIESLGAQLRVAQADVSDESAMRAMLELAERDFGTLHGVIHAAGILSGGTFAGLEALTREACQAQLRPKLDGLVALDRLLAGRPLDFRMAISSLSTVLGGLGMGAYASANACLDAFAQQSLGSDTPWLSVDWDAWDFDDEGSERHDREVAALAMRPQEGAETFLRLLGLKGVAQVVVSTGDLQLRLDQWVRRREDEVTDQSPLESHARPDLATDYVAPRTDVERNLAAIWGALLGVESVGLHDNFFDLGGHSLLANQVRTRVLRRLDIALPVGAVFENPTIAQLAQHFEAAAEKESQPSRHLEPVSRDQPLPLSPSQTRFWFLAQVERDTAAYNVSFALRLRGDLDIGALEWSLGEILRRHEILRTTFVLSEGTLQLHIDRPGPFELPVIDVSTTEDPEREALRHVEDHSRRPFDLSTGPLHRFSVVRLGPNDHVLLTVLHHVSMDEWSVGVFWDELSQLYRARHHGQDTPLEDLPVQYADYAYWARKWQAAEADDHMVYWKRQLEGLPTLELPTDRPRPPQQTFRGAKHGFAIPTTVGDKLQSLGRAEGCTLFMAMLAAFKLLLARYSSQTDIVVGTPRINRDFEEVESLIGPFLNTLVLRTDLSGNPSFRELLRHVRDISLDAFQHGDTPYESLVIELQPDRDLSRNPLFQVLFQINEPAELLSLDEVGTERFGAEHISAKFDLTLSAASNQLGLFAEFEYNVDLFDEATIRRMERHLSRLIESVVEDPDQVVWALPILTETDRVALLAANASTAHDYPRDRCFHELFEDVVGQRTDHVAAVCGDTEWTFGELNARANRLAHHLRSLGARPESRIGLCVERGLDMLAALLGILKSGAAYVPMDPNYPPQRIAMILEDAGVDLLVTHDSLRSTLPTTLPQLVCLDTQADRIAACDDCDPTNESRPEHVAYVIFTSGSTGRPKGVQIEHRALVNFLTSMAQRPGLSADDVLVAVTTISFDIAGLELYLPLLVGGRTVIAADGVEADGRALSALLEDSGATAMQATPATWQLLLESGWSGNDSLKGLCGGEALPRDLAERLLPRCHELWNMYGPTETTIWSLVERVSSGTEAVPIGQPIGNTQIYITDRYGCQMPVGVPGALCLGGDGLARGYLGRASLTAEKFMPDAVSGIDGRRLYDTGDVARLLDDGTIEFRGRADHQLKIRGFRIEPGEIEHVLSGHDAVAECAVVAQRRQSGLQLVAHFVLDGQTQATVSELRRYLRGSLPDYMVPAGFVSAHELPRTPNGKIDRKALQAAGDVQTASAEQFVPPTSEMEKFIAGVWSEELGVEKIGLQDNFFDLGGHSLLAMKVAYRVEKEIGEWVAPMDMLVQTLGQFAGLCDKRRQREASAGARAKGVETESSTTGLFGRLKRMLARKS